ncbi:SMODS domain-containing nucleotidyltransferase [Commensalibacter oyaizuii]|uniref:Adenylyl/Guanylyl and SMODS C-terminal sensor domain-containing protein n=1 Tax=Commensalibacter oyaizuii TaxID=3043873 RepID=A0ABT6Q462_9PROT|nr:hypothetical protein [Commensalibacter sp. TBRC 16381]MDI2091903.1 hypothetical protein [Commensalibacter sp. TBRC 16381]
MSIASMFEDFLTNLRVDNADEISRRYETITCSLNKRFRNNDEKFRNRLQVGSYGRFTAIKGISDLDMLYIMPDSTRGNYWLHGQYKLLSEVKEAIQKRYSSTNIKVDRLVVCVTFTNFYIEVQPVFEQEDGSFLYPDTYCGGSWKKTDPRKEIQATKEFDNQIFRHLCKMVRAWKNKCGVVMGGLLIDTLVYNFLRDNRNYDGKSYSVYHLLSLKFFEFIAGLADQEYFLALGSNQRVKVTSKFQREAKKAYDLCLDAIESDEDHIAYKKWRKIYGYYFPAPARNIANESLSLPYSFENTEEFIERDFSVDIRYSLELDCIVTQNGYRPFFLRLFKGFLAANKDLEFNASNIDVPCPYILKWKVLNIGREAERKNCIRGQIFDDKGYKQIKEKTSFSGNHLVECYVIKDNVVVARQSIIVPIEIK